MAPRRLSIWMSLCMLGVSLASCASPPTYAWRDEKPAEFRIGSGDRLRINVWKHDEISQEVTVRPDGNVSLPLVGEIRASGRSGPEIAKEIEAKLAKFYTEPVPVTVVVTDVKSYKIYVLGEVAKPGELTPGQPITVLQSLAMAGGLTPFARRDAIVIVRRDERGERRIPFSYSAVVGGDLQQNLVLQSGDTIVVP
ncbi:MAG: polysaccharide biosynthesis/export family protein [Polyangiales bacterium]